MKEMASLFCCKELKFKKHYSVWKMPAILYLAVKKNHSWKSQKLKSFWTSYKTSTTQYLSDEGFVIFQIFTEVFLYQLSV